MTYLVLYAVFGSLFVGATIAYWAVTRPLRAPSRH
jgi:hypothetical protein